jgi:hypothetical protein
VCNANFHNLFISIILLGSFPLITSACSCAELSSVEEEFERSNAVFSGKVVDLREKQSIKRYQTKSVLFEVTNTWKGVKQSQIIISQMRIQFFWLRMFISTRII